MAFQRKKPAIPSKFDTSLNKPLRTSVLVAAIAPAEPQSIFTSKNE